METTADHLVPCLPENAPFTAEQRAYLNGFLAGLFSRMPAPVGAVPAAPPAEKLSALSILFGSQTGNAEGLAKRIAKEAGKRGFAPTVHDLAKYPTAQLASEERVLIVTSTFGDGEPPDNAKAFWDFLSRPQAPRLSQVRFSVCAIGDSNYPQFCGFGKELDLRLEALGARRVSPRVDCDLDLEEPFAAWLHSALAQIGNANGTLAAATAPDRGPAQLPATVQHSRSNPFPATLLTNQRLNEPGSEKDTRHFEIALEGSGLSYEAGDALGVIPMNCPELVDEILNALNCTGNESVPGNTGTAVPLRDALLRHYEIAKIPLPFLKAMAEKAGDADLNRLTAPGVNGEVGKYLWGLEIIDLLLAHPGTKFGPNEFVRLLKKLQPRLYSISSSPKAFPDQVHLTVNVVRFESHTRRRKGVCSTFLAERTEATQRLPVFVHNNKNFRPPANDEAPMIMVRPGTGIAPFRAFLQERRVRGASGKNWLFYGDQRAATDFMYRDELEAMQREGILTHLDTAFSRDQDRKVYVQDRMRENAKEFFDWLEGGASFYVCGDANRMAKDVDAALHEIVQSVSGKTQSEAADYITALKQQKRYQRDVY